MFCKRDFGHFLYITCQDKCFFTARLVSIWVRVFTVSGLNYKMVWKFFGRAAVCASNNRGNAQICYLDDWVATGCCFDGSSAALSLIVRSVVGFGLNLYLQVILAKLAWQRPI